jgi:1-acyl-sn-glycerol-3-phosphate acyltransferase
MNILTIGACACAVFLHLLLGPGDLRAGVSVARTRPLRERPHPALVAQAAAHLPRDGGAARRRRGGAGAGADRGQPHLLAGHLRHQFSLHPCRFVAKAEIRAWPVLGWLAEKAGTVFIARGNRRDLRHIFKGLVTACSAASAWPSSPRAPRPAQGSLLPFHANLFEAAIDAKVPVQPFALSYEDPAGASHPSVDFIGETSFAESIMLILNGPPVRARLAILPAIATIDAHRRDVAEAAHQAVAAALGVTAAAH